MIFLKKMCYPIYHRLDNTLNNNMRFAFKYNKYIGFQLSLIILYVVLIGSAQGFAFTGKPFSSK